MESGEFVIQRDDEHGNKGEFEIKELKRKRPEEDKKEFIPPRTSEKFDKKFLPKPPFGAVLIGSTGQGKTSNLKKLLTDEEFYGPPPNKDKSGKHFDVLVIISDSLKVDPEYDCFESGSRVWKFHSDKAIDVLNLIKDRQEAIMEDLRTRDRAPRIAVIIDDCIHLRLFQFNSHLVEWYFTNGRHYLLTIFIPSQYLRAISPVIRANSKLVLLHRTFELAEVEKFMESFVFKEERRDLMHAAREIFDEDYQSIAFLPLNRVSNRFWVNFETKLELGKQKQITES